MAGNNQHFLPRFMQKGFASNSASRKRVQVWYFEKGKAPEEKNTKQIGEEFSFYGEPGAGSLDDVITKKEDLFAKKIDRIREEQCVPPDDVQYIAEFVYAMALRTVSAREKFTELISSFRPRLEKVTQADQIRDLLSKGARPDNPLFRKILTEEIKKQRPGANHSQIRRLRKLTGKQLATSLRKEAASIGKKEAEGWDSFFKYVRWDKFAEQQGKKAQMDTLTRVHSSPPSEQLTLLKSFTDLKWTVESFPQGSLILGDVAVIRLSDDSSFDPPILGSGKGNSILLPLSHSLLLIGSKKQKETLPPLELINRSSAELSLRFFISRKNSEKEAAYLRYLAQRAPQRDEEG